MTQRHKVVSPDQWIDAEPIPEQANALGVSADGGVHNVMLRKTVDERAVRDGG